MAQKEVVRGIERKYNAEDISREYKLKDYFD
jgi:hypothetical protein